MSPSDDPADDPAGGAPRAADRTVFNPGGGGGGTPPPSQPPAYRPEPTAPPGGAAGAGGDWGAPGVPSAPPASPVWNEVLPQPAPYSAPASFAAEATPSGQGRIQPGVLLNHIYEVRRFIARGGMGEVYEGINVNTDERVAIKVMLSHLALDPAVQAMFRKEARTLTRLSHPALVQYRVLAQEPQLGVLYIVTDYIEGGQLGDYVGKIDPNAEELDGLTRRLASGLAAAHELGAIHRDMSPDNVLLPDGRLHEAKVIDFGIAKDLDASSKTIVGDGFAGKLGFVAPEQFGDYDREIGPWTDVYSLGLVILSVAAGKPIDMGSTLVEAIDKRRKGPDLSPLPERLRPVFEGMLKPNPLDRYRSMKDVLSALDASARGAPVTAPLTADAPVVAPPAPLKPVAPAKPRKSNLPLIGGVAAALLLLLAIGGGVMMLGGKKPAPTTAASGAASGGAPAAAAPAATRDSEKVRQAVEAALPGVACTWLDIDDVNDEGGGGVALRLSGVAGSPVEATQAVQKAASATGAKVGLVDTSNVFPVGQATCSALDTFRGVRADTSTTGRRITSQQSNWELMKEAPPCNGPNAKVVVDLNPGSAAQNFTLLGFDRKGGLQQIFNDRAALEAFKAQQPELVTAKGDGGYSTTSCYNETGLVGEALVTGPGPFAVDLPNAIQSDKSKVVDAAWLKSFADKAKANGWKTSMVWYRVVDDQPN